MISLRLSEPGAEFVVLLLVAFGPWCPFSSTGPQRGRYIGEYLFRHKTCCVKRLLYPANPSRAAALARWRLIFSFAQALGRGSVPGALPSVVVDECSLSQPTYHMTTTSSLPQYQAKVMFPRRGMHRGESRGVNKERSRYFDFARAGSKDYRFVDDRRMIRSYLI